ncbi:MAG: FMN-binding protein [bacterium]|nr:FMN-binding protein [Candidatus Aquidulcis frankliniae]
MPKRGLISLIFTIAGLRLIVGYVPPAQAAIGGISPDPSVTPDPSASATVEPTPTPTPTPDPSLAPGASATPNPTSSPTPKPTAKPAPTATAAATLHSGTYTGSNFNYNYGTMQVTVTISGGKVTDASVSQSGRWAIGYRKSACTEAVFNSAAIDLAANSSAGNSFVKLQPSACSGATYSWWGYANSLQAAIDQATY